MRGIRFAGLILVVLLGVRPALAQQCADGSPPPCGSDTRRPAPLRRVDPPLDDRTWIVVPFNNVTRTPDVDYLRDASVNLLYLDLAKWTDIRVVDDARVTDLIRQVPEARTSPLSLDAAMAIAKRAGAGRLVMGNVIKQGAKTTLVTKVFDVRRGTVIRSPQQDLVSPDSLMSAFGQLAVSILGVAPPPGTDVAKIGTSRVDAYQEYLAGVTALKRFDLEAARPRLERAIKLDSNFALPRYSLSVLIGWDAPNDPEKNRHAAAAARLAVTSGLPARERGLMKAHNEFEQALHGQACATYGSLIKSDSTDVDALYGLGECSYHDAMLVRSAADTGLRTFEGNWNTAIRAFERVLQLDPSYHLAFQHILDALSAESRTGYDFQTCAGGPSNPSVCPKFIGLVMNVADTLAISPILASDTARLRQARLEYSRSESRRKSLERAKQKAQAWIDAAPDESRPHLELGNVYTLLGEVVVAQSEFAKVKGKLSESELAKFMFDRIDVGLKAGVTADMRRLIDSGISVAPPNSGALLTASVIIGRLARFDSAVRAEVRRNTQSQISVDYTVAAIRVFLTGGTPQTDSVERRYLDTLMTTPRWATMRATQIFTFALSPERRRVWPPLKDLPGDDHRATAIVALSKGDTARVRAETRILDSLLRIRPAGTPDSLTGLFVAELYLALRDSAAALSSLRRMMDTTLFTTPLFATTTPVLGVPIVMFWPRLLILRGDLEAAVGDRAKARASYRQFIDLWSGADAEFQPFVERARSALAALRP